MVAAPSRVRSAGRNAPSSRGTSAAVRAAGSIPQGAPAEGPHRVPGHVGAEERGEPRLDPLAGGAGGHGLGTLDRRGGRGVRRRLPARAFLDEEVERLFAGARRPGCSAHRWRAGRR